MKKSTKSAASKFVQFNSIRMDMSELLVVWAIAVSTKWESAITLFLEGVTRLVQKAAKGNPDWIQETLIRVWQHMDEYDPSKGELSTWVWQQARGGSQKSKRDLKGDTTFTDMETGNDRTTFADLIPCLDDEVQIAEELDAIASFLDTEQSAILAAYFMGTKPKAKEGTFQDVAELLNVSVPTARNRVLSIVNACRKHFGVKGRVEGLTKYGMTVVH